MKRIPEHTLTVWTTARCPLRRDKGGCSQGWREAGPMEKVPGALLTVRKGTRTGARASGASAPHSADGIDAGKLSIRRHKATAMDIPVRYPNPQVYQNLSHRRDHNSDHNLGELARQVAN